MIDPARISYSLHTADHNGRDKRSRPVPNPISRIQTFIYRSLYSASDTVGKGVSQSLMSGEEPSGKWRGNMNSHHRTLLH